MSTIFKTVEEFFGGGLGALLGHCSAPPKHVPLRILGLEGTPCPEEIKTAYRRKLLEVHPDLRPAFEHEEFQSLAQVGRSDLPDVQELVWARDCALAQAPRPAPLSETAGSGLQTTRPVVVSPTRAEPRRQYYYSVRGEPRVCRFCGKELAPPRPFRCGDALVVCDECKCKEAEGSSWRVRFRQCPGCGVWTLRNSFRWAVYCGDECRIRVQNARRRDERQARRANRTCPVCGATFTPKRRDGKFCSAACRLRAFRQAQRLDGDSDAVANGIGERKAAMM